MTQEEIKKHLTYDPETGVFTKISGRKRGPYTGFKSTMGYRKIHIDGHEYFLHRLAFLIMTGSMPEQVDHINRNKEDNRWENLRATNNSLNQANTVSKSRTGHKGIRLRPSGRWEAGICLDIKGKKTTIHLGTFDTLEEALEIRKQKSKEIWGEHWNDN